MRKEKCLWWFDTRGCVELSELIQDTMMECGFEHPFDAKYSTYRYLLAKEDEEGSLIIGFTNLEGWCAENYPKDTKYDVTGLYEHFGGEDE